MNEWRCKSCNQPRKGDEQKARKIGTRFICTSCDDQREAALRAIRERSRRRQA
jgi:hypothetical protein